MSPIVWMSFDDIHTMSDLRQKFMTTLTIGRTDNNTVGDIRQSYNFGYFGDAVHTTVVR